MYDHEGAGRCDVSTVERPRWAAVTDAAAKVAAEELRFALGRLLAGTARPGEVYAAILTHGPKLCRFDNVAVAVEERELDNAD